MGERFPEPPTQDLHSLNTLPSRMQGPPGTGKTSTIVAIVSALLGTAAMQQQLGGGGSPAAAAAGRVLVCAQSNAAVDELALRLSTGVRDTTSGKQRCARAGIAQCCNVVVLDLHCLGLGL